VRTCRRVWSLLTAEQKLPIFPLSPRLLLDFWLDFERAVSQSVLTSVRKYYAVSQDHSAVRGSLGRACID
jgi:hypothetical protein